MEEWTKEEEVSYKNRCLAILEIREHSQAELKKKLLAKDCPEGLAVYLVDMMLDLGLVDDLRYAQCFIRSKSSQGWGKFKIINELKVRGVSGDVVQSALLNEDEFMSTDSQLQRATALAQPKISRNCSKDKIFRFLATKGYSSEIIRKVLDNAVFPDCQPDPDFF